MSEPYVEDDRNARAPEPEPVMAGPDENPTWGRWSAYCASCCAVTGHAGFTDEHGCEVGSGCASCRWLTKYDGCRYAGRTTTIEAIKSSFKRPEKAERKAS